MRIYQIVVDTYEAKPYPVVTHCFQGMTREEAHAYLRAHLGTCSFFRGCASGQFADFKCENVVRCEGWVETG
jgi:hypothetical protein